MAFASSDDMNSPSIVCPIITVVIKPPTKPFFLKGHPYQPVLGALYLHLQKKVSRNENKTKYFKRVVHTFTKTIIVEFSLILMLSYIYKPSFAILGFDIIIDKGPRII